MTSTHSLESVGGSLKGGESGSMLLPPLSVSERLDEYKIWDCVIDERSRKPRLKVARKYFLPLTQEKISLLKDVFKYWRNFTEYLVIEAENQFNGKKKHFAMKCSKRGNDVYGKKLESRLGFLKYGKNIEFFKVTDFSTNKKVTTKLLWITLTYDSKRCSLNNAWINFMNEFNLWITNLRNKYGGVWYVSFPQAFPDPKGDAYGYPHMHLILYFEDVDFTVFPTFKENKKGKHKLVFRIKETFEIKAQGKWHSFIDVKALSSMKGVLNYARKYCQNVAYGESDEAVLNNAITWLFKKKSFNVSGKFRENYNEFINSMCNSKTIFQKRLDGGIIPEWKFKLVGIYCLSNVGSICSLDRPPPWFVSLSDLDYEKLVG